MTSDRPDIAARFAFVIAALCRVVAAYIAVDRDAGPWIIRVCNRLQGIARRVERLAAQARAGTVPKLRAGFTLKNPRKPAIRPPIVLAGKPGWLMHRIQQTAVFGESLRLLLADPEMAALLAAAPQLASILRPLCRALDVTPPPLRPRPAMPDPASSDGPAAAAPDPPGEPASPPRPARPRPLRARPIRISDPSTSPGALRKSA